MAKAHILMEHLGTDSRVFGVYTSKVKMCRALDHILDECQKDGFEVKAVVSLSHRGTYYQLSKGNCVYKFWKESRELV